MRVAVITTSRADWNALQPVVRALQAQGAITSVMMIGDHAGWDVVEREMHGVAQVWPVGNGGRGYGAAIRAAGFIGGLDGAMQNFKPDIAVLCGDRYETLAGAHVLALRGIPLAHIAGGDRTSGSSDDKYRDAISMLADMHFPTHEASAERLLSMGLGPNVYCYGSPAIDRLYRTPVMPRAEVCKALGLEDSRPFILANWQPETPRDGPGLEAMLSALAYQSLPGVFVGVNPDPGADSAEQKIAEFIAVKPSWRRHQNLAPELYLSALLHAHCLIGNSSSGVYEAPYYGTPVINIGTRQSGRPEPECMRWILDPTPATIGKAIADLERGVRYDQQRLFGDGTAAPKIAAAILTPLVFS